MARAIFGQELDDPDFAWLIATFRESNPEFIAVESGLLPVVLISAPEQEVRANSFMGYMEEDPEILDERSGD